jgi:hypothetical protein
VLQAGSGGEQDTGIFVVPLYFVLLLVKLSEEVYYVICLNNLESEYKFSFLNIAKM